MGRRHKNHTAIIYPQSLASFLWLKMAESYRFTLKNELLWHSETSIYFPGTSILNSSTKYAEEALAFLHFIYTIRNQYFRAYKFLRYDAFILTYGLDPHTYLNPVYNIMFVSSSNVIKHCEVRISSSMKFLIHEAFHPLHVFSN